MRRGRLIFPVFALVTLAACNPFGSASRIDDAFGPGAKQCSRPSSSLVSWWRFEESLNGRVKDLMGVSDLIFSGEGSIGSGKLGNGWNQSSSVSLLTAHSSEPLQPRGPFTVLAWAKGVSTNTAHQTILGKWKPAGVFTSFSAFDAATLSPPAIGYTDAVFDGRYVYFAPYSTGSVGHALVLRYDSHGEFSEADSWKTYNAASTGGKTVGGYVGAVFDGRYVYFVPYFLSPSYHGVVLRLDTLGDFESSVSWSAYDAGTAPGTVGGRGYSGAVFDGHYVYFVPAIRDNIANGRFLRLDTRTEFSTASSWTLFDSLTLGTDVAGFFGGVSDGRYLYFAPHVGGKVLRFDSSGDFGSTSSWQVYDASTTSSLDTRRFAGAIFDGRYVYFIPFGVAGTAHHGRVLRLDTQGDFSTASSWSAYDAGTTSGLSTVGYLGGNFDGRYVYFSPNFYGSSTHANFLRYDSLGAFSSSSSWSSVDSKTTSGLSTIGYAGSAFDGRYIYFAPLRLSPPGNGKVMRLDTLGMAGSFALDYSGASQGGIGFSPSGPEFRVSFAKSVSTVSSGVPLSADWHLVAGVYDGEKVGLYVDGENVGSRPASGIPQSTATEFVIGAHGDGSSRFTGQLDEVQLIGRALSHTEVRAIAASGNADGFCQ